MNLEIHDTMVPGTRLTRAAAGNVTGRDFLDRVFFPSDGVMLSRIRDVSGIDGSTSELDQARLGGECAAQALYR